MHGIGAHSALAVKRQRRRREQQRKQGKRTSKPPGDHYEADNKVMGTITMFHVGSVFLLLAAFLMLGALLTSESRKETAELVGTGVICLIIGLFLIVLNRFYGQKEEDELADYVETRLGRSRSGQRLYHEQDSMPEHLGAGLGPSASASMDSNMSREMAAKAKGNKKGKKSKNRRTGKEDHGIEETTVNGADPPKVKVDLVNEHNQSRNHHPNDISSVNVVLDRIAEEDNYHHNQPISYVNANYDDVTGGGRGASNNLYRVYDRDSHSRGAGAV